MSTVVARRKWLPAFVIAGFMIGLLGLHQPPAQASVTGGCEGSADFSTDSVGAYTPDFDTPDNPIRVPKDDGNVASWEGSVPGENKSFSGKVEIRLGPVWLEVADWGFPDHNGENADDQRADSGEYDMDELWDVIPKNIAQGIYEARASHSASSVDCDAQFFVKFEGNAFESPIVIVVIVLLIIFLVLLVMAGRATGRVGFFEGRPVLAVIAALFLAITIAILLQQFCVAPLDNTTTIILPLGIIVIGLIIAKFAPFGGARELRRVQRNLDVDSADDVDAADIAGSVDVSGDILEGDDRDDLT